VIRHLFIMAVALTIGALLLGTAADRLSRRGIWPQNAIGSRHGGGSLRRKLALGTSIAPPVRSALVGCGSCGGPFRLSQLRHSG